LVIELKKNESELFRYILKNHDKLFEKIQLGGYKKKINRITKKIFF